MQKPNEVLLSTTIKRQIMNIPFSLMQALANRHLFSISSVCRISKVGYNTGLRITEVMVERGFAIKISPFQYRFVAPIKATLTPNFSITSVKSVSIREMKKVVDDYIKKQR